jgi:hypothetical protein
VIGIANDKAEPDSTQSGKHQWYAQAARGGDAGAHQRPELFDQIFHFGSLS